MVGEREREKERDRETERQSQRQREILRNWFSACRVLERSKADGTGQQARGWRTREELPSADRIPSCSGEVCLFVLFRTSNDWMRPIHIVESDLIYSKSTYLYFNLIQNTFSQKHQNNV